MRSSRFVLSATLIVVVSSCASAGDSFSSDGSAGTVSASTPETAGTGAVSGSDSTSVPAVDASGPDAPDPALGIVYSTSAGVIETPEHGPEIAFILAESYPPQGGGLPVSNWSWQDAPDFESASGTTWGGRYRLVGTWDGATFTLTEPVTSTAAPPFERVYDTPTANCDEYDYRPVLDFLETLDRDALGIIASGDDAWDGRCGAAVEAYFDTTELREALEPMADRIATFFYFTPLPAPATASTIATASGTDDSSYWAEGSGGIADELVGWA